jgi:hypothetical protein
VNHSESAERRGASKVFDLGNVSYERDGMTPVAIVDGLLLQWGDTVMDNSRGATVTFKKALIPARFYPRGVLVYGQLLPYANTITVRNPRSRMVAREHLLGADEEAHFKHPTTLRRSCRPTQAVLWPVRRMLVVCTVLLFGLGVITLWRLLGRGTK